MPDNENTFECSQSRLDSFLQGSWKKKKNWTRADPTHLDLSVLVRRVRERVQGESVAWIRQKKGQLYHSSEWRIADLLLRHHISTHTSRRGRFRSEDQGSAVILCPRGRCEVEWHARGYRGSGCSGPVTSSLSLPVCFGLLTANDAVRWLGWPDYDCYCQNHNLTLKWNFHLKQTIQNQGTLLFVIYNCNGSVCSLYLVSLLQNHMGISWRVKNGCCDIQLKIDFLNNASLACSKKSNWAGRIT